MFRTSVDDTRSALTTAFNCRAGGKERVVSQGRNAGPVKCNALSAPAFRNDPLSVGVGRVFPIVRLLVEALVWLVERVALLPLPSFTRDHDTAFFSNPRGRELRPRSLPSRRSRTRG